MEVFAPAWPFDRLRDRPFDKRRIGQRVQPQRVLRRDQVGLYNLNRDMPKKPTCLPRLPLPLDQCGEGKGLVGEGFVDLMRGLRIAGSQPGVEVGVQGPADVGR